LPGFNYRLPRTEVQPLHALAPGLDSTYTGKALNNKRYLSSLLLCTIVWFAPACATTLTQTDTQPSHSLTPAFADVVSVQVGGEPGAYQFAVEIASPDTGCEQYADWWEVVTADGQLAYRRILTHSHVDEQPFIRSGGPVVVGADSVLWVRAHMNTSGYGGAVLRGTPLGGFAPVEPPAELYPELERDPPQPEDCPF
jgi:hypothetical protein